MGQSSNIIKPILEGLIFGDMNIKKTSTTNQLLNREVPPTRIYRIPWVGFLGKDPGLKNTYPICLDNSVMPFRDYG